MGMQMNMAQMQQMQGQGHPQMANIPTQPGAHAAGGYSNPAQLVGLQGLPQGQAQQGQGGYHGAAAAGHPGTGNARG